MGREVVAGLTMFSATIDEPVPRRVLRYVISRDGSILKFYEVLDLWQVDANFREFMSGLLAEAPFAAYCWETPGLSTANITQPFEFVLLDAPAFCSRATDQSTFRSCFTFDELHSGVVTFLNEGGDATLVVPSPRTDADAYGHLAAFVRQAPSAQVHALWQVVSASVKSVLSTRPLWLSTAGGGVAWLHIRLDSQPKYYGYLPYRRES